MSDHSPVFAPFFNISDAGLLGTTQGNHYLSRYINWPAANSEAPTATAYQFGRDNAGVFRANVPTGNSFLWSINGVTQAVISSSGNVGLGIIAPADKLHVVSSPLAGIQDFGGFLVSHSGNTARGVTIGYDNTGDFGYLYSRHTGVAVKDLILGNTAIDIKASGNIGIGVTTPPVRFSNTNTTILDASGTGPVINSAFQWSVNGQGFTGIFENLDATASLRNGLLVKIAATDTGSRAFSVESGAVNRLIVRADGNVGIGTTAPSTRLHVVGTGAAFPATSGTVQSAGHIVRLRDNSNLVLDLGGNAGGGFWIQSTDATDLNVKYPLLLNPTGGNVGIGTTGPGALFHVFSTTFAVPNEIIGSSLVSGFTRIGGIDIVDDTANPRMFGPVAETFYAGVSGDAIGAAISMASGGNVGIGVITPSLPTAKLHINQAAATSGSPTAFRVVGGAHTNLQATIESTDIVFNLSRTVQWATGDIATQRFARIQQPTVAFVGASSITSLVATLEIESPLAGTNATFSSAVCALNVGSTTTMPATAGLLYSALRIPAHTLNLTGVTTVTSTGPAAFSIGQLTISNAVAQTSNDASTLYIPGPPLQAGAAVITRPWSVWIDSGNVRFDGGYTGNVTPVGAGAYSVLLTDYIVGKTAITGGGDTVTLPTAASAGLGKIYIIKDQSGTAGANTISVNVSGAGTIDTAAVVTITVNFGVLRVYTNGTNWFTF